MAVDGDGRERVPSVARLRPVVQPPSVTGRAVEHWTAGLYLRRVSPYVTRLLLRAGISADAVTGIMIATGVAAGAALVVPGPAGVVLAVLFGQLQMLWDCCDGEVARWRRQQGARGVFLDKLGHHLAEAAIAVGLGLRVAGGDDVPRSSALVLGVALAGMLVLNRSVNDMVHAARAAAGLPLLAPLTGADGAADPGRPEAAGLARLRDAARWLPVHRLLHSVELTLLVAAAAVVEHVLAVPATGGLLVCLVVVCPFVLVGHVVAVLTSSRLRAA